MLFRSGRMLFAASSSSSSAATVKSRAKQVRFVDDDVVRVHDDVRMPTKTKIRVQRRRVCRRTNLSWSALKRLHELCKAESSSELTMTSRREPLQQQQQQQQQRLMMSDNFSSDEMDGWVILINNYYKTTVIVYQTSFLNIKYIKTMNE